MASEQAPEMEPYVSAAMFVTINIQMGGISRLWLYSVINTKWGFGVLPFRAEALPRSYHPPGLPQLNEGFKMDTAK